MVVQAQAQPDPRDRPDLPDPQGLKGSRDPPGRLGRPGRLGLQARDRRGPLDPKDQPALSGARPDPPAQPGRPGHRADLLGPQGLPDRAAPPAHRADLQASQGHQVQPAHKESRDLLVSRDPPDLKGRLGHKDPQG